MQITITINLDDKELEDLGKKMVEGILHDEMRKTGEAIIDGIKSVIGKI
jgi:hypothetical protein